MATTKGRVHTLVVDVATADVNSGITVLAGQPGRAITVVGAKATATGSASGATGVYLQDDASSAVIAGEFLAGGLISATEYVASKGATYFTAGAGWQVPLTGGAGLKILKHGSSLATTTTIKFVIRYIQKP